MWVHCQDGAVLNSSTVARFHLKTSPHVAVVADVAADDAVAVANDLGPAEAVAVLKLLWEAAKKHADAVDVRAFLANGATHTARSSRVR